MKGNEMLYTIPLGDVYEKPRKKRAPRAIKEIKKFVKRHAKLSDEKFVKISAQVNSAIWARSIEKPPRNIKVKLVKDEVYVYVLLPEQKLEDVKKVKEEKEEKETKKEAKKEKKEEKKTPEKEEPKESEEKKEDKKEKKDSKNNSGEEKKESKESKQKK